MSERNRVSGRRWLEHWGSKNSALAYFRRIWNLALANGLQPGHPVPGQEANRMLRWLVQGHPEFREMSREGISHFTFRPDGRGNHRFVLVDAKGMEHPFSTDVALTGFVRPLSDPEAGPLGGLHS